MNIIVCIKQVPDTTKVEVDPVTGVLKRNGIDSKMNPYDLYALETALRIKEQLGGSITVISMGPPQAEAVIRESYSLGTDAGILLTDRAFAERNRQEFTANVSHELKSPLQSIIGSAELLETGLVKEEVKGKFIGNIRKEASRLVSLINDIIRLSQLDERGEVATEAVELMSVANEVVEVLSTAAAKKNVSLTQSIEAYNVQSFLYQVMLFLQSFVTGK